MQENEMRDLAFLKSSNNRKKVIDILNKIEKPLTPTEIAKKLNLAISSISRSLNELKKARFVNCIKEGRIKLYYTTDKVNKVLTFIED